MVPRVRGVALIIEHPSSGHILTLREMEDKPWLGKLAGMRSIPMETLRDSESHDEAIQRLIHEELSDLPVLPDIMRIGAYLIVPRIWVTLYTARSASTDLTEVAKTHEVDSHAWVSPEQALGLWLRRGAQEMIQDYLDRKTGVIRRFCIAPSTEEPLT